MPSTLRRRRLEAAAATLVLLTVAGCSPRTVLQAAWLRPARTHAVLLNGGGRAATNYQSHLQHVRTLVALLHASGVRRQDITIFSADGADPAADLATRETPADADLWLLPTTGIGAFLRPPVTYVNSVVDGFTLRPARKDALRAWFTHEATGLRDGDTLLFYVTDHGEQNRSDLANNTITLWDDSISVAELHELFALLAPGVRTVMLMSQCFSGSFAYTILPAKEDALPAGNLCGYFSSTADRFAYGCYPENRGRDGVGYSYEFFDALARLGRFSEAQRRALVTDDTPDVPHRTSDFFLERLVRQAAESTGRNESTLVDDLLAEAWQNRAAWEPELRLLDRIGHTFGVFSPRTLAELSEQAKALPEFAQQLSTYAERWREALESLRQEVLRRFVESRPSWRTRLDPTTLQGLDDRARREVIHQLLAELVPFVKSDAELVTRLHALRQKTEDAAAAAYRTQVRLAVVLRLQTILASVAGREYVERYASATTREALARLTACEDLRLVGHPPVTSAADLDPPEPFPPLADEQHVIDTVMPAWMGIQYRPVPQGPRQQYHTPDGAVLVAAVYPNSPATAAGLQVGDVILGPPGEPFKEPNQVREWTMYREVGSAQRLAVLRNGQHYEITLRPGPFPLALPRFPGPPNVGTPAPPLKVDILRGPTQLVANRPRLLFFWATWCAICHSSLPELLAFGTARNVEVVAITDEEPGTVRHFLQTTQEPFPAIVATDAYRRTFEGYGVSGTPTFVLVDEHGVVRHYQVGYKAGTGLSIEGWHWDGGSPRTSGSK